MCPLQNASTLWPDENNDESNSASRRRAHWHDSAHKDRPPIDELIHYTENNKT